MKHAPLIFGFLTGLSLAIMLGETPFGMIVLTLAGGIGGGLSWTTTKGAERVYWGFLIATVFIVMLGAMGIGMHRLLIIFPMTLALGYFVARIVGRFTGQREHLPG